MSDANAHDNTYNGSSSEATVTRLMDWPQSLCFKISEKPSQKHKICVCSAVAHCAWLETEGLLVQASPASLRYGHWARHIYPSLVLVQPRKTHSCLTEILLMGCKESNQTNNIRVQSSLSVCLSFSLLLQPAFKVCKQFSV